MQDLSHWMPPRWPDADLLDGRHARLERVTAQKHGAALHIANRADDAIWDFLPYGPFPSRAAYCDWIEATCTGCDPTFYAAFDKDTGRWGGVASYLRIAPAAGTIEVGHINLSKQLQRTRAATEAMMLMMQWAFEAGYRRYEWKCNAANLASRRAAERYGFSYEGVFRQAAVVKGRNRDTAWFACIDSEWPAIGDAFQTWLDPANFDAAGCQNQSLSALTAPILVARDPVLAATHSGA